MFSNGKKSFSASNDEEISKIEYLNYAGLTQGTHILGQIAKIKPLELVISLPNSLVGYVPITNISTQLSKILEQQDEDVDMSSDDEEENESKSKANSNTSEPPALDTLFKVGQFVKTTVVSTTSPYSGTAEKRHIELSIDPAQVNADLSKEDYLPGMAIQGSVTSIEDHGLILDIGSKDGISGFISNKDLKLSFGVSIPQSPVVGQVLLLTIISVSGNGRTLTLTSNPLAQKVPLLTSVESIKSVSAGVVVDATITDVRPNGIFVNIYDHATGTIPLSHIPGYSTSNSEDENAKREKFVIGDRIKARVINTLPHLDKGYNVSLSLLPHILELKSPFSGADAGSDPLEALPVGQIIENAKVVDVELNRGIFLDVHYQGLKGYAHITKLSDTSKPNALGPTLGPYRVGTVHRARILDYSYMDNLYKLSLQESVLKREFLNIAEIPVGAVTQVTVSNILPTGDIVVSLSDGIKGFVPSLYVSDVKLAFPEKKYKTGSKVKARVISIDLVKNRLKLTLKKTYVNYTEPIISSYTESSVGVKTIATVTSIKAGGIIVEFFNNTRAFIHRSEISEAFVSNTKDHFRLGQTVNVRILEVDVENERMLATCRTYNSADNAEIEAELEKIQPGKTIVSGNVVEKAGDSIILDIQPQKIRGILNFKHLSDDSSDEKKRALLKKVQVGQTLDELLVLDKDQKKKLVILTSKPSIVKTAKEIKEATNGARGLPASLDDVQVGQRLYGFISNVTAATGVFVSFASKLTALAPKSELFNSNTFVKDPTQYFNTFSTVACTVLSVDPSAKKFIVSLKDSSVKTGNAEDDEEAINIAKQRGALNPVDTTIKKLLDYKVGRLTKARILGITNTHVNLEFADNQLGRIDISEVYDKFEDIENHKKPLEKFLEGNEIDVRIIGTFNAKSAKSLAVTRPDAISIVLECSCKPSLTTANTSKFIKLEASEEDGVSALEKIEVGSVHTAFVHHLEDDLVFVNITPKLTGNIAAVDMSTDLEKIKNLRKEFPEGCALQVSVLKKLEPKTEESESNKNKNAARNTLILSTRTSAPLFDTIDESLAGLVTPAEIIKKSGLKLTVRISGVLVATLHYADIVDDYSGLDAKLKTLEVGSFLNVKIVEVDVPNQKIFASCRPSLFDSKKKTMNKYIGSFNDLKAGETVEGFISNIANSGIFVELGHSVVARVQIKNVSDAFLADWKRGFVVKQKVKGVILSVDSKTGKADLSLKQSHLDGEGLDDAATGNKTFEELQVGDVFDGRIKRILEYGIFVKLNGTKNVDGLCHISEIADVPVTDIEKLFSVGDKVKAKVLAIDEKKKRLSLGLKASYFDEDEEDEDEDEDEEDEEDEDDEDEDKDEEMLDVNSDDDSDEDSDNEEEEEDSDDEDKNLDPASLEGLAAGSGLSASFDWSASLFDDDEAGEAQDSDAEDDEDEKETRRARRNRKRTNINVEDKTAELNTRAPQSAKDYERLLVSKPNSSVVWISYMAFQLQLNEVEKAREIAERALKTISFRDEQEKLNVWIALLNMEANFGTPGTVKDAFKRALQFMDSKTVYLKMANIYQAAGNIEEAGQVMKDCCKKLAKEDASLWSKYGEIYYKEAAVPSKSATEREELLEKARGVLDKAQNMLNHMIHEKYVNATRALAEVVAQFAKYEYQYGEVERGRSLFEGLLALYKKRVDLWGVYIDFEIKYNVAPAVASSGKKSVSKEVRADLLERRKSVESLFERLVGSGTEVKGDGTPTVKLSLKQAKFFFKKWLGFESDFGDSKAVEYVKAKAADYVSKYTAAKEASKIHESRLKNVEGSDDDESDEEESGDEDSEMEDDSEDEE